MSPDTGETPVSETGGRDAPDRPVAFQRCDRFVARTMNWMYDHLRWVRRHRPVVIADAMENRTEFPELEVIPAAMGTLGEKVWRRLVPSRIFPPDRRRMQRYRPVVFHSHFGYVAMGDFARQQALELPWVVAFYGADVYLLGRDPAWRDRYARLFERASLILALGPVMVEALAELGAPRAKLRVHPLGVDARAIPSADRVLAARAPLEILFAGTFREKKGLVYLLEAARILGSRGVSFRLHIVGDAGGRPGEQLSRRETLEKIARDELNDRVRLYSWLEFRELVDLALQCHVFAAPSVTASDGDAEGTPFVIQQMALTGMPVVSTRHSDIPFLYGPLSDWLIPERDAVALANRIQGYAEDPETLIRDGRALRARVQEAFDVRRCADRLSDLYEAAGA